MSDIMAEIIGIVFLGMIVALYVNGIKYLISDEVKNFLIKYKKLSSDDLSRALSSIITDFANDINYRDMEKKDGDKLGNELGIDSKKRYLSLSYHEYLLRRNRH